MIFHCQVCTQRQLSSQCHQGQIMTVNSSSFNSSFSTFQHTDLCIKAPLRQQNSAQCSSIHHRLRLSILLVKIRGSHSKACLICRTENICCSFPNITSCNWCKVSMQIKLPAVKLNLCLLFIRLNLFYKPSGKNATIYIFPKFKYCYSWTAFALMVFGF